MSRQLEQNQEDAQARLAVRLLRALDGGLEEGVRRAGGELDGFSIKNGGFDYLCIVRASFPAGAMVAFVGGASPVACILKAEQEAGQDGLRWRADKFRQNGLDGGGNNE